LLFAFLYGSGETIRDKPDVANRCGEPPAKRHPKIKGEPQILRADALRISAAGSDAR
jgi:hypothetical protein